MSANSSLRSPARLLLPWGVLALLTPPAPAQFRSGLKPGLWQARHCPKGWVRFHSKAYQIQSQAGLEKAKRLAKHMEGMLRVYKKLFPPGKSTTKRYAVKLFKGRKQFIAYSGKPGAGGYYTPVLKEMVLYDTGKWSDEQEAATTGTPDPQKPLTWEDLRRRMNMDILGVAAHEGWHQYFHWYVTSWVYLPSWINEGMGDYFYTATPKKMRGKRIPAELGRLNEARLPTIVSAVRAGRHVPIKKIIRYSKSDYYANAGLCYAEGWSLCHYLLHSGKEEYEAIVPRFIKRFKDRGNWRKNTDLVFKKIDLDELERDWKAWVLAQKVDNPLREMLEQLKKRTQPNRPAAKPDKDDGGARRPVR